MKKLITQFIKFTGVGFLCFFIDYGLFKLVTSILKSITAFAYCDIIGNVIGFSVSVMVNYYLSMNYVFQRKEDMDKKKEFSIFIALSIIGCIINTIIVWVMDHQLYQSVTILKENITIGMMENIAKVTATAVVTVYNFVTRKLILEKKEN